MRGLSGAGLEPRGSAGPPVAGHRCPGSWCTDHRTSIPRWWSRRPSSPIPRPPSGICPTSTSCSNARHDAPPSSSGSGSTRSSGSSDGTRNRTGHPRPIDIDILLWGRERIVTGRLTIPPSRPDLPSFVLAPLVALEPRLTIPGQGQRTVLDCSIALETAHPVVDGYRQRPLRTRSPTVAGSSTGAGSNPTSQP